eukprot:1002960_1
MANVNSESETLQIRARLLFDHIGTTVRERLFFPIRAKVVVGWILHRTLRFEQLPMFTPKRSLLVVFVIVAIEMGLTGAANNFVTLNDYRNGSQIRPPSRVRVSPLPNAFPQRQHTDSYSSSANNYSRARTSANNQSFKLRGPILSAVMLIILILGQILVCFENKNCQRAAVILNYLSTGVMVLMLYFLYIDISAHMAAQN